MRGISRARSPARASRAIRQRSRVSQRSAGSMRARRVASRIFSPAAWPAPIRYGAALAVSEMVSARPELRGSRKTLLRLDHAGEPGPVSVQLAGSDPAMLAAAARFNVERGAQIIDINMGCPAKKVCNVAAGSALLADESLVARIVAAVVAAVDVPVTVKIRTGPSPERRNAVRIARIVAAAGARMLAMHGRTRYCMFDGQDA